MFTFIPSGMTPREKQRKAQYMRDNPTKGEAALWAWIRDGNLSGLKFETQVIIRGFIADFVCHQHKLIIEVDGSSHDDRQEYDEHRTSVLNDAGFRVVRYTNHETIKKITEVLPRIAAEVGVEMVIRAVPTAPLPKARPTKKKRRANGKAERAARKSAKVPCKPFEILPIPVTWPVLVRRLPDKRPLATGMEPYNPPPAQPKPKHVSAGKRAKQEARAAKIAAKEQRFSDKRAIKETRARAKQEKQRKQREQQRAAQLANIEKQKKIQAVNERHRLLENKAGGAKLPNDKPLLMVYRPRG